MLTCRRVKIPSASAGFKRAFLLPGVVIAVLELWLVVYPLFRLFQPTDEQLHLLASWAALILGLAATLWVVIMAFTLLPVQRASTAYRRGTGPTPIVGDAAYCALGVTPLRALWLRSALWIAIAVSCGAVLVRYSDWAWGRVLTLVSVTGLHALVVNSLRAAWYSRVVGRLRPLLYPDVPPLRQFADRYARRVLIVAILVGAGGIGALAAFIYSFLPIKPEEYLAVQTFLPGAVITTTLVWTLYVRRVRAPIDSFLRSALAGEEIEHERAVAAYRAAQALPYGVAGTRAAAWVIAAAGVAFVARYGFHMEVDNAVLMFAAAVVIDVGAALYEAIWLRDTMRPLLLHLQVRPNARVRDIRSPLSLRVKLLISFGGLVLFACGLSLFWGFIQYKTLATQYLQRAGAAQARLGALRGRRARRPGQRPAVGGAGAGRPRRRGRLVGRWRGVLLRAALVELAHRRLRRRSRRGATPAVARRRAHARHRARHPRHLEDRPVRRLPAPRRDVERPARSTSAPSPCSTPTTAGAALASSVRSCSCSCSSWCSSACAPGSWC